MTKKEKKFFSVKEGDSFDYTEKDEQDDFNSVWEGVVKQAKERKEKGN